MANMGEHPPKVNYGVIAASNVWPAQDFVLRQVGLCCRWALRAVRCIQESWS